MDSPILTVISGKQEDISSEDKRDQDNEDPMLPCQADPETYVRTKTISNKGLPMR